MGALEMGTYRRRAARHNQRLARGQSEHQMILGLTVAESSTQSDKRRKASTTANGVKFYKKRGHLFAERIRVAEHLVYRDVKIGKNSWGSTVINFQGMNINRKWGTVSTYGGKLVE